MNKFFITAVGVEIAGIAAIAVGKGGGIVPLFGIGVLTVAAALVAMTASAIFGPLRS